MYLKPFSVHRASVLAVAAALVAFAACTVFDGATLRPAASSDAGDDAELFDVTASDGAPDVDAPLDAGRPTYIVVIGGDDADDNDSSNVYVTLVGEDGTLGPWQNAASLPQGRRRGAAAVVGGRHIVVPGGFITGVGGSASTIVGRFEQGTIAAWVPGPDLPAGRSRQAAFAMGDRVFVVGGFLQLMPVSTVWSARLDPDAGQLSPWEDAVPLPEPLSSAAAVTHGERVYVIGGEVMNDAGALQPTSSVRTASIEDGGIAGGWSTAVGLPLGAATAASGATSTHVYVSGGYVSGGSRAYVKSAMIAGNPPLAWSDEAAPAIGRAGAAIAIVRSRLYLVGGLEAAGNRTASIEVAFIDTNGRLGPFRNAGTLPKALAFHSVVVVEE